MIVVHQNKTTVTSLLVTAIIKQSKKGMHRF